MKALNPLQDGKTIRCQRGSSVLIVLTLLACMAIIIVANSTTLHLLKEEIKLTDKHQQAKYGQGVHH